MENHEPISGVYLVAGLRFHPDINDFLEALEQAFRGGIRLFQLRTKDDLLDTDLMRLAKEVRCLTKKFNVIYIINDRPDIAKLCEADGLHLGPADMPVRSAREIAGNIIIGKSSHNLSQVQIAVKENIDYLSVGPIYETDCKPVADPVVGLDLLNQALKLSPVPVVAIGGISSENMREIRQSGVGCAGVIRDIMAARDIRSAASRIIQSFDNAGGID